MALLAKRAAEWSIKLWLTKYKQLGSASAAVRWLKSQSDLCREYAIEHKIEKPKLLKLV